MSLVKDAMLKSRLVTFPRIQPSIGHFTVSHPTSCALVCRVRRAVGTKAVVIKINCMTSVLEILEPDNGRGSCIAYTVESTSRESMQSEDYLLTFSSAAFEVSHSIPTALSAVVSLSYGVGKRPNLRVWSISRREYLAHRAVEE
jgi:hypothetical protein